MTQLTDEQLIALASAQYGEDFSTYQVQCMFNETAVLQDEWGLANEVSERFEGLVSGLESAVVEACQKVVTRFRVPAGFMGLELVPVSGFETRPDLAGVIVLVDIRGKS